MGKLKCPECGEDEQFRSGNNRTVMVLFKCGFSATFDAGLSEEEMQKKLDEFKASGKMDEWIKRPWF